jgi:hypothetical protein
MIFESAFGNALQKTISKIIDDKMSQSKSDLAAFKYMKEDSMDGAYKDDLEMSGPAYLQKKPEGSPMAFGNIKEGAFTRYIPETFALGMATTEEAVEDEKYSECINAANRLGNALWNTIEQFCALFLCRCFTAGYIGGDGIVLSATNHPLPQGGTASNYAATPAAPSRVAFNAAIAALKKMKGHDGVYHALKAESVVCPTEQYPTWQGLILSEKAPEPGNFNEINVVNRYFKGSETAIVEVPYWNTTTTNWGIITDAENGLQFLWRVRPKKRDWKDNANTVVNNAIRTRFTGGWTEWRGFYGNAA